MKIEADVNLLKNFLSNFYNCKGCKYEGYNCCVGKSCEDSKLESLIEKSKLVLDFDLALTELEKLKKKCTDKQKEGLLFAIEKLQEIKADHLFMKQ